MSTLTYRYRIKDQTSRTRLLQMVSAINSVWNYCNDVSLLAYRRDSIFLSAYDLHKLTAGTSQDLRLSADTIQQVCTEYVTRRRQCKKIKLKWRSKKRSLGWIPFKAAYIKLQDDTVTYCGYRFRLWLSRPVEGTIKTGSFSQDARGRWYVNFQCDVPDATTPIGQTAIGIDLGLVHQIACSDGIIYSRENLTRTHEAALAMAQRARKKTRVKAIQAKIANTRADWTHKATTAIARSATLIVIGDVSSSKLIKTPFAKSTLDAAWHRVRFQLTYKAKRLAGLCVSGREYFSSVTCSTCGQRTGPSGLSALGVRAWVCSHCGSAHDRDVNAARNILHSPCGTSHANKGIRLLWGAEDVKKLCRCGGVNDTITLADTVFVCPACGFTDDRDFHAADNLEAYPRLGGTTTPVDNPALACPRGHVKLSWRKQELPKVHMCALSRKQTLMSMTCRHNASRINMACAARPVRLLIGLALLAAPVATFADMTQLQNICIVAPDSPQCNNGPLPMPTLDCTLVVPDEPLTAGGLATPYQLRATNPDDAPCHEANPDQSAFVEAAILDPATGRLSIYRPLVIDQGTTPAVAPVVPDLPANAVVGLWFGFNGANLALDANDGVLNANMCVQGLGQFAYCNAPTFFAAVHAAINDDLLRVPPLGTWDAHGIKLPCPSVRSWDLVDQDQSDNLLTQYLLTANGFLAQNTAENQAQFPDATVLSNPSDERLLTVFVHPALEGCTSWMAPDLTNPGHTVGALALNELQAGAFPPPLFFGPPAWIPAGDPFAQAPPYSGNADLGQVNAYRRGVDQPQAKTLDDASTRTYCANLVIFGIPLLQLERPFFIEADSPDPAVANSLWTFMMTRFHGTYMLLNENGATCMDFLGGLPNPVSLTTNADGVVTAAEFNLGAPSQDPSMENPEQLF